MTEFCPEEASFQRGPLRKDCPVRDCTGGVKTVQVSSAVICVAAFMVKKNRLYCPRNPDGLKTEQCPPVSVF